MKLRIGSRGSQLAVAQAEWVAGELAKKNSGLEIAFTQITTSGDRNTEPTLVAAGGKGVFVKEIEDALLARDIDLAVHSLKDVPQDLPAGLMLGPCPLREDPRDAMISRFGEQLNELPRHSTVGTSSPRRRAQLLHKFKKRHYQIVPLRGNVDTRLKKLHEGQYDAIVLAAAGLKRLGLEKEITQILEPDSVLPAPCQGALGLELREADKEILQLAQSIKDEAADATARAERAFLQGLGGNCLVPVGAFSSIEGETLLMRASLLSVDGEKIVFSQQDGPADNPEWVGYQLAELLLYEGGSELMGLS